MTACPSCGAAIRPIWPTCRACGTLLMAPPAPVVRAGDAVATVPSAEEQFFTSTVFPARLAVDGGAYVPAATSPTPSTRAGSEAGKWIVLAAMVAFLIGAIAIAAFTVGPSPAAKHQTPVVLAPRPPAAGLSTDLSSIVRVEAESARHTALQNILATGTTDLGALATAQPNYHWVAGTTSSTDPHTVSVSGTAGAVTVAVAASNHDVCAFAQSTAGAAPQYVTMAHVDTCAAVDAPATGWSTQAGGAASDLPDDNG